MLNVEAANEKKNTKLNRLTSDYTPSSSLSPIRVRDFARLAQNLLEFYSIFFLRFILHISIDVMITAKRV